MDFERTRVLITVMTYPNPSKKDRETVCTAGITEDGNWVRLYPIPYRMLSNNQKFRKYQWIEVDLTPKGSMADQRKESRKPRLDTLTILGEPLSTKNNWIERKQVIEACPTYTKNQLETLYEKDRTSLGIVRPTKVLDVVATADEREWSKEQQAKMAQFDLFQNAPRELIKIPYKFHYVFECKDSKKEHTTMISDWELGVLFLKERIRLGDEKQAVESVRNKYREMVNLKMRDVRFFMGTVHIYNTWIVTGVFWPPKEFQEELF